MLLKERHKLSKKINKENSVGFTQLDVHEMTVKMLCFNYILVF